MPMTNFEFKPGQRCMEQGRVSEEAYAGTVEVKRPTIDPAPQMEHDEDP